MFPSIPCFYLAARQLLIARRCLHVVSCQIHHAKQCDASVFRTVVLICVNCRCFSDDVQLVHQRVQLTRHVPADRQHPAVRHRTCQSYRYSLAGFLSIQRVAEWLSHSGSKQAVSGPKPGAAESIGHWWNYLWMFTFMSLSCV